MGTARGGHTPHRTITRALVALPAAVLAAILGAPAAHAGTPATADRPAGTTTITVSAIINLVSSDPIGTTAPFDLTITG